MKTFLAIYTGTMYAFEQSEWKQMDATTRRQREEAGKKAWRDWGAANLDAIVDTGSPLGKTKRVGPDGITDIRNAMTGYTIIRAESHDAAAKMFLNHPHFSIFPGEAVEIMECLPLPG